ncbi:hypothetical protein J6590_031005 [Homalodisca vitripennis]|nr:hypothetical protein J6590_031005 [Homalodisca vitripennis]
MVLADATGGGADALQGLLSQSRAARAVWISDSRVLQSIVDLSVVCCSRRDYESFRSASGFPAQIYNL